jgi:hypothetical protein
VLRLQFLRASVAAQFGRSRLGCSRSRGSSCDGSLSGSIWSAAASLLCSPSEEYPGALPEGGRSILCPAYPFPLPVSFFSGAAFGSLYNFSSPISFFEFLVLPGQLQTGHAFFHTFF